MKKFVLLAHGDMDPTPQFQAAHQAWWSSLAGHVVDSGNPLFNGRNVTTGGQITEIAAESEPALGYSIIEAETCSMPPLRWPREARCTCGSTRPCPCNRALAAPRRRRLVLAFVR